MLQACLPLIFRGITGVTGMSAPIIIYTVHSAEAFGARKLNIRLSKPIVKFFFILKLSKKEKA